MSLEKRAEKYIKDIGLTLDYCIDSCDNEYVAQLFDSPKEVATVMKEIGAKLLKKDETSNLQAVKTKWQAPNGGQILIEYKSNIPDDDNVTIIALYHDEEIFESYQLSEAFKKINVEITPEEMNNSLNCLYQPQYNVKTKAAKKIKEFLGPHSWYYANENYCVVEMLKSRLGISNIKGSKNVNFDINENDAFLKNAKFILAELTDNDNVKLKLLPKKNQKLEIQTEIKETEKNIVYSLKRSGFQRITNAISIQYKLKEYPEVIIELEESSKKGYWILTVK